MLQVRDPKLFEKPRRTASYPAVTADDGGNVTQVLTVWDPSRRYLLAERFAIEGISAGPKIAKGFSKSIWHQNEVDKNESIATLSQSKVHLDNIILILNIIKFILHKRNIQVKLPQVAFPV